MMEWRRRAAIVAIYALALNAGLLAAFHPTILGGFRHLQTDPGDSLLNHYILEHSWQWLTRSDYVGTLWSPPCFYPQPNTLAYSENLLGTAPIYWLLRSVADPLLAFQLWMLVVTGVTFLAAGWMLRRFGASHGHCCLGAWLFAFGWPRVVQIGHQQLLPQMFAPLALWAAWCFLERPRSRSLAIVLAAVFLQTLASIYLGWLLAFALLVFIGCGWLFYPTGRLRLVVFVRRRWRRAVPILAIAGTFFAVLLAPYQEANRGFHRSYKEIAQLLPTPGAWLRPPKMELLSQPSDPADPSHEERWLSNGNIPIALAALAIVALAIRRWNLELSRKRLIVAAMATGAALILVSLRWPWGSSAWWLVYRWIPGGNAIRAVGRIATIVYLFVITGGILTLDTLSKARFSVRWRHAIIAGLSVLGVGEQIQTRLPSFDPGPFFANADRLAERIKGAECAYIEIDPAVNYYEGHLTAMWAGLCANVPVVNGYSGRYPPGYPAWTEAQPPGRVAVWLGPERSSKLEYVANR